MTAPSKTIDWDGMKPHFEAGIRSLRELGLEYGCTAPAILKHADKQVPPWQRNLKGRIQARADAKVNEAAVNRRVNGKSEKARQAVVVETNATLQAGIRLTHRTDIAKARKLTMGLFAELDAQTSGDISLLQGYGKAQITVDGKPLAKKALERLQTAIARAEALPNRTVVVKNLTEALRVQLALERQAFGIDDQGPPPDGPEFSERLIHARQRAASR